MVRMLVISLKKCAAMVSLLLLLAVLSFGRPQQTIATQKVTTETAQQQEYNPYSDSLYRWYLRATVIGVIGGLIGLSILIGQTLLLKQQINHLVQADRAWIITSTLERKVEMIRRSDDPESKKQPYQTVVIEFKNFGKSPAIIRKATGGLEIVGSLTHAHTMLEEPYSSQINPILAPGEVSNPIKFIVPSPLSEDEMRRLQEGMNLFMVAYGLIEYSDSFGKPRTSKFCYIWDSRRQQFNWLCHNPDHNQYI